ncbi:MAG: hypothetical protein C4524_06260 [Candidatus Zixiibacteriota bacterium]|nr:MAG: hypothetical protein C4524_06260 [candidate division Zixibacteria bacterium]
MTILIKFLFLAVMAYLVYRRVAAWLSQPTRPPAAPPPPAPPPPFDRRDVIEAKFTEVKDEPGDGAPPRE